jgi:hypothetical protein
MNLHIHAKHIKKGAEVGIDLSPHDLALGSSGVLSSWHAFPT